MNALVFLQKPRQVTAVQWTGDNIEAIDNFTQCSFIESSIQSDYLIDIEGVEGIEKGGWVVKLGDKFILFSNEEFQQFYEPIQPQRKQKKKTTARHTAQAPLAPDDSRRNP